MVDRTADEIQRDIEQARASLATAVDQLTYRTNPKRLLDRTKAAVIERAKTTQGKAVLGGAGVLVALLVVRKIAKR